MKAWFVVLPLPARVLAALAVGAALLVALLLFYDWLGSTLLDSGGMVG